MEIRFDEIITGDRLISLCDFVFATKENVKFHKNLQYFAKTIIVTQNEDFVMDIPELNRIFSEHCERETIPIKLFIYTHCLVPFMKNIVPYLDDTKDYILYIHNSDDSFDDSHQYLLHYKHIKKVYAQNCMISYNNPKVSFLPMGIANSMWPHGNLPILYSVMNSEKIKEKNLYVNINPFTFPFRKEFLEKNCYVISESKPYREYLNDLSSHKFCLCIRGHAVDTHRFWESLYLKVIPVIVNNIHTKCNNFIRYLEKTKLPFFEIKEDKLEDIFSRYPESFFNQKLYETILDSSDFSGVKLSNYIFPS